MQKKLSFSYPTEQALAIMLPSPPFYFEMCDTPKDQQALHKLELSLITGASIKRQQDFCTGRFCAHQVLDKMGYKDIPLLADQYGAPLWPPGITGSISHSGSKAIAVAALKKNIRALGIDIQEFLTPFPYNTINSIFSSSEKNAILLIQLALRDRYAYSIFSAKESVLKCCYYAYSYLLELSCISITMHLNQNNFSVYIPEHSMKQSFFGKCKPVGHVYFDQSYIYTGFWLYE
ncbi:MAG: 4'-phosphopantetheinyl transferase superfamily protein [Nitrosomonas sp.]|nr:4'-phosphopantetheinyl transferase superfamily protein [Nitrosomonas sp.]